MFYKIIKSIRRKIHLKKIKYLVGLDPTAPLRNKNDILKSIKYFEKTKPDVWFLYIGVNIIHILVCWKKMVDFLNT